jgi:transcriptional regulator with XRE-family HTH domain
MRNFGVFLSNLRSSAGLSLEELARLVESSRSTLSRLENDEVPQPFKGSTRKLILALAEILCTSKKETGRYLELAGIDRSLLTEVEEIQLGFTPHIPVGSSDEKANLERWKQMYEQLIQHLGAREVELGVSNSPPNLKLKIQEYANVLQEIEQRLDILSNRQKSPEHSIIEKEPVHYATTVEGRPVVGHQYGEEFQTILSSTNLYSLASSNARWLMQLANIERFAVDDCMVLTNSKQFAGWGPHDVKTTLLTTPLPIPDDLEQLMLEKLPVVEKNYLNAFYYRLLSFTPSFSERKGLEVILAPLSFYELYSLNLFFDEPLLTALDGSPISIRQKYGNTALTYTSTDRGTSLIPAPVSIQCVLVTADQHIVLMQRSFSVAYYPNHWSASFEETMSASDNTQEDQLTGQGDTDFFAGAIRGLDEEFAIPADAVESIKILSLNVEYLTLSVDVITVINVNLTAEEVRQNWLLRAWHRDEASKFGLVSTELPVIVEKLYSKTLWHPTARMRLIQFLFHTYGIDEVTKAIKKREQATEQRLEDVAD